MPQFTYLKPPTSGTAITKKHDEIVVPDDPFVPFIEGGGTGADIWRASVRVFDAAVQKAYAGKKRIVWSEVLAGEKAKALNGDYLSDASAAQVGGLGMAPGANTGDEIGFFEATHGTAPKYAGKDVRNPGSVILSGVMMLQDMGWKRPATLVENALAKIIQQKHVTFDLARQMEGATELKTSQFADAIIANM